MNTFCVLPWFGQEINWGKKQTHCCLLPEHYNIDEIKSQMLEGKRPLACQKCWILEDQGIKSDRIVKNETLDFYWDRDLTAIQQYAQEGRNEILMLKLFTSYTCNATCVSCNPFSSSSWQELSKKMGAPIQNNSYKFINLEQVQKQVDFSKLITLSLIGGEPLYEKRNFELLEYLLELGNNQVFISMVTNGSVVLTSRQKNILSKFKNLNFSISIDGTGPVFEYLRYPLKWDKLLQNLSFFRSLTDNISSNYTISNLNILYHPQTVQWFNDEKIVFSTNPIYSPNWLQPRVFPAQIKDILKQTLSPEDYLTFVGEVSTEQDLQLFKTMLVEVSKQDQAKKIRIKDYLPELDHLINNVI